MITIHDSRRDLKSSDFFFTTLMIHWKNYFFVSSINTKKKYFHLFVYMTLDETSKVVIFFSQHL